MTTLDELARLLAEATPGPWKQDSSLVYAGGFHGDCFDTEQWCASDADAALIAAAVNALPKLLRLARAAGAVVEDPSRENITLLDGALAELCAM